MILRTRHKSVEIPEFEQPDNHPSGAAYTPDGTPLKRPWPDATIHSVEFRAGWIYVVWVDISLTPAADQ